MYVGNDDEAAGLHSPNLGSSQPNFRSGATERFGCWCKDPRGQTGPQHNVLFYIRVWMTPSIRVSSSSRSDFLKLRIPRFVVCVLHPRIIQSTYSKVKQEWLSCTHWYENTVELLQGRFKCKIQSLEQKTLSGAIHMGCMLRSARASLIRESRVGASGR